MRAATTQEQRPWRTTVRTVFQGVVGLAASWALIVQALGLDPSWQWVTVSLTITAAITRVMALPAVEGLLARFVPWLAADPQPSARATVGGDLEDDEPDLDLDLEDDEPNLDMEGA